KSGNYAVFDATLTNLRSNQTPGLLNGMLCDPMPDSKMTMLEHFVETKNLKMLERLLAEPIYLEGFEASLLKFALEHYDTTIFNRLFTDKRFMIPQDFLQTIYQNTVTTANYNNPDRPLSGS